MGMHGDQWTWGSTWTTLYLVYFVLRTCIDLGLRKLGRQCCEAAVVDTYDGS